MAEQEPPEAATPVVNVPSSHAKSHVWLSAGLTSVKFRPTVAAAPSSRGPAGPLTLATTGATLLTATDVAPAAASLSLSEITTVIGYTSAALPEGLSSAY